MIAVEFRMGEYHNLASNWWFQYHKHDLNPVVLARFGVMVMDKDGPLAITHIYPASTANLVWIGFTVTNPSISRYKAGKALKLLLAEAENAIRRLGYNIVYTGFDSPALQKLCKRAGYIQGSAVLEQWKELK